MRNQTSPIKPFSMCGPEDDDSVEEGSRKAVRQAGQAIERGMERRGAPMPSQGSHQIQPMGCGRKK